MAPADGLADGCGLASGVGEALVELVVLVEVAWVAAAVGLPPATGPLVAPGDASEPTDDVSAPLDELGVAAEVVSELLGVALLPAAWAAGATARVKPPMAVSTHAR